MADDALITKGRCTVLHNIIKALYVVGLTLLVTRAYGETFVITEWASEPAPVQDQFAFVVTEWSHETTAPKRPDVLIDSLPKPLATDGAAHTPMAEVVRVLDLLPRPQVGFVDLGCGYDARWCIAAAEKWGCRVTGVEIDPDRVAAARDRVRNLGLEHLITIIEGDAGEVSVAADVGVAYLYPDLLARLKPRLEALRAFASYLHQPAGLPAVKNGDSWVYMRRPQQTVANRPLAQWGGQYYAGPVCSNPGCAMCASIRGQIASQQSATKQPASTGHWVKRCYGGHCRMEWVPG